MTKIKEYEIVLKNSDDHWCARTSRNVAPELIRVIELAERKLKNIAVYDLYDNSSVEDTDWQAQCRNMYEYAVDILNEINKLKG